MGEKIVLKEDTLGQFKCCFCDKIAIYLRSDSFESMKKGTYDTSCKEHIKEKPFY